MATLPAAVAAAEVSGSAWRAAVAGGRCVGRDQGVPVGPP